jgi:1,4-alpha-glucan branching enzyme
VGDFNGWSVGATPLVRRGEAWTVELPLAPGRHVYSFVVDGSEWVADATAPRVPEDDFGRPSSVVLVGSAGP